MIIVDIVIKPNQSIKFKSERKPKVEPPRLPSNSSIAQV